MQERKRKMTVNNTSPQIGRFSNVDASKEAEQFVAFLERIERLPAAGELRERSYELLDAGEGSMVVDVGCGTGRVVDDLAGRGIKAIGVDISEQMIAVARQRFPNRDFRLAAAESLPFEDGVLDRYRAERLYQHLKDPVRALAEARRVLVPGGRIVLVDQDYDMWAIDADDEAITRALMRAQSDTITNRWMGRRYHNLLLDAGFVDVVVEVKTGIYTEYAQVGAVLPSIANAGVAAGTVTRKQADAWLAEQERRGREGRFFEAMPLFLASGRRP
jgi:ubiquinone/menaquinone biosynthesis C-methylase UbiE